jgi:hypothetical protein
LQISGGNFTFFGLDGLTSISYNQANGYWIIKPTDVTGILDDVIGMYNGTERFPLGTQTWFLNVVCNERVTKPVPMSLKLTRVRDK